MPDFDPTNKGALFNEKEIKSDNHPVMTGKLNVEGKEYRIAAWEKTSKTGQQFYSLAISEPKEQAVESDSKGIDYARQKAAEIKAKQVDQVAEVIDDEPIDLSSIPF